MMNTAIILIIAGLLPFAILLVYFLIEIIRGSVVKKKTNIEKDFHAPVSIIISCYNEVAHIEAKLEELLSKPNWIEGSEILVIATGCDDGTNEVLKKYFDRPELNIKIMSKRQSKIQGLNMVVPLAQNDILVFSDCRQKMKQGSIQQLINNFSDPTIGTISSTLIDTKHGNKASFFRFLLNKHAIYSSRNCSSLNVFGALYAQRKSCFRPFPEDLLFDDLFVVVATLSQNKRLIQEEEAQIYDVQFDNYYGPERIERLVRGLLLFRKGHRLSFKKMSVIDRLRFFLFKYLKLIAPFFLIIGLIGFTLVIINEFSLKLLGALVIALTFIFLVQRLRNFFLSFIRINFYFILAVSKFYTIKSQSNEWTKLRT